jgi:hypothetical protein
MSLACPPEERRRTTFRSHFHTPVADDGLLFLVPVNLVFVLGQGVLIYK